MSNITVVASSNWLALSDQIKVRASMDKSAAFYGAISDEGCTGGFRRARYVEEQALSVQISLIEFRHDEFGTSNRDGKKDVALVPICNEKQGTSAAFQMGSWER